MKARSGSRTASDAGSQRWANGIGELAKHYDLFLLDQYGVLHDGYAVYPGVADALERLRALRKQVVVITNSGRSAANNEARLREFAVPVEYLDAIVTSGDVAREWLREQHPGARCKALTSDGELDDLKAAGLTVVDDVADAELLLVSGFPMPARTVTEARFAPLLDAGAQHRLPLICCNPDERSIAGDTVVPAPGAIAAWYRQRGGDVRYFGKPYREIFDAAMRRADGTAPARTIMIGDLPETDLRGAEAMGIAAAFALGGVCERDTPGPKVADRVEQAAALISAAETRADWMIPSLRW